MKHVDRQMQPICVLYEFLVMSPIRNRYLSPHCNSYLSAVTALYIDHRKVNIVSTDAV
jgi:hypothetical protein